MRALLSFAAGFMLLLTAWTVGAHAAEGPITPVEIAADATPDGGHDVEDHALIHQHGGCHGHFLDIARWPAFPCPASVMARLAVPERAAVPDSTGARPALRPPQA